MATPLTADQLLHAFKKWGVRYEESPGWRTRNRAGHGAWGPMHGLLLHHTGDDAPDSADQRILTTGRSDLPGPLCHWGMRDTGVLILIGWGRANHAGQGSVRTYNHLVAEDYSGNLTPGPTDSVDGNSCLYGQETMYSGGHAMTDAAYHNTCLAFAAVCDAHGWTAKSAIGHKEWTSRKPDPGHLDMATFRRDVQALLNAGPGGVKPLPAPKPVKKPATPVVPAKPTLHSLDLRGNVLKKLPELTNAKLMLDWSWAKPDLNVLGKARRCVGVARYLSADKNKTITDAERAHHHANGDWITFVYEDGSTPAARQHRALEGRNAGVIDAQLADKLADELGVPDSVAIAHAVDTDATYDQVVDYWKGIYSAARRPRMVYGGASIVTLVVRAGLAKYGWQTTSWSPAAGGGIVVSPAANFLQLHAAWRAGAEISGLHPTDYDPNLVLAGAAVPVWRPGQPKRGKTPAPAPKPTPTPAKPVKPAVDPAPAPADPGALRVGVFNWQGTDNANDQWVNMADKADLWALCEVASVWQRAKLAALPNGWGVWPVLGTAGAVPVVYRKDRLEPVSQMSFKAGTPLAGVSPQRHINETVWKDLKTGKLFTHDHGHAPHHYESHGKVMVYAGAEATKYASQPERAKAFLDMMANRVSSARGPWLGTGDWNCNFYAERDLPAAQRVPWFPWVSIGEQPGVAFWFPKTGGTHNDGRAIDYTATRGMKFLDQKVIVPAKGSDPAKNSDHYAVITTLVVA